MAPTPTEIPAELVLDPRSRHAGGHSGRPPGPLPWSLRVPYQPLPRTEFCLVHGHILGCDLGRLHLAFLGLRWYYKTPMIDLEIWTFVLDFVGLVIYCRYMQLSLFSPDIFGLFLVTICIIWVESLGSLGMNFLDNAEQTGLRCTRC